MDSPPLLFSSSHFRRICADLAARYAINRRTLDRCGCESPRRGPSVDPLNTIGMERRGGNFEVASFERIIYHPSLFRDPLRSYNIGSKEVASIFSSIGNSNIAAGILEISS